MRDDQVSTQVHIAGIRIANARSPILPADANARLILAVMVMWSAAGVLQHLKAGPGGV